VTRRLSPACSKRSVIASAPTALIDVPVAVVAELERREKIHRHGS